MINSLNKNAVPESDLVNRDVDKKETTGAGAYTKQQQGVKWGYNYMIVKGREEVRLDIIKILSAAGSKGREKKVYKKCLQGLYKHCQAFPFLQSQFFPQAVAYYPQAIL